MAEVSNICMYVCTNNIPPNPGENFQNFTAPLEVISDHMFMSGSIQTKADTLEKAKHSRD